MNDICLALDLNNFAETVVISGKELFKKGALTVVTIGNVYGSEHTRIDESAVCELYEKYGCKLNYHLDGTYTLFIADAKAKKAYVFQDFFGASQALYFHRDGDKIIISNKLKSIMNTVNKEWKLNYKTAKEFLLRGYNYDSSTLVEGINKIPGKKCLVIDADKKTVKVKKHTRRKAQKREVTEAYYDEVVERQCVTCAHEDLYTTLSSGYDSNYILHNLNKNFERDITTFCIGGTIGRNEIPDAIAVKEGYGDKVKLNTKLVDGSSLNKFPEIVYALEGAIYESGVFLQYELAKLVSSCGCKSIMLGECADQVLNFEMYHPFGGFKNQMKYTLDRLPGRIFKKIYFKPYKLVYEMASCIVIKKNGIMMNYFGVSPEYPYMRKEFVDTCENAVKIGEKSKEYHKKVINNLLPEFVTNVLKKVGGATELKTLFIGDITLDDIKKVSEKSEFYIAKEFDDKFYAIDYHMKIVYLELFKKIFIEERDKYLTDSFGDYELKHFFSELNK